MPARPSMWISVREACRILDINGETFLGKYAAEITQQRLRDMPVRYSRVEVEAIAKAAVVPPSLPG